MAAVSMAQLLTNMYAGAGEVATLLDAARAQATRLPPREREQLEWVDAFFARDAARMEAKLRAQVGEGKRTGAYNGLALAVRDAGRFDEAIGYFGRVLLATKGRPNAPAPGLDQVRINLIELLGSLDRRQALDSLLRADSAVLANSTERLQRNVERWRARLRGVDLPPVIQRALFDSLRAAGSPRALEAGFTLVGQLESGGQLREADAYRAGLDTMLRALRFDGDRRALQLDGWMTRVTLLNATDSLRAVVRSALNAPTREAGHPLDHQHARAARLLAMLGDTTAARDELDRHRKELPNRWQLRDSGLVVESEASIALQRGHWQRALQLARLRETGEAGRPCYGCSLPLQARAWYMGGQRDSTTVLLTRFVNRLSQESAPTEVGPALATLAQLESAARRPAEAEVWRARLRRAWRDADKSVLDALASRLPGESDARRSR